MRPVLVTIPISHYCEKARWALERAGIAYTEEAHPPFLHMRATRPGGGRSTPQLRLPDRTLTDSPAILRWVESERPTGLFPASEREAIEAFEKRCDDVLGPSVRRYAYHHLLDQFSLVLPMLTQGISRRERLVFRVLTPAVPFLMRKAMKIDARTAERSSARILEVFDEVDAKLADGRAYLFGDSFTAGDLVFGALAAPLVSPPEHPVKMPGLDSVPSALRRYVEEVRERPAGRFILRLYARDRGPAASPRRG